MEKQDLIYKGKAKSVYATADAEKVIIYFNDDATALNGVKHAIIDNKGVLNNPISTLIFKELKKAEIPTHHLETLNDREQLCQKVKIIPLEVITRNVIAGSMANRLGFEEGSIPPNVVLEICYKNDKLNDPLINDDHAVALGVCSYEQLKQVYDLTRKINELLKNLFDKCGIILVDFKIEFGINSKGEIVLADEISPDCMRLWDKQTKQKLDKDLFRRDMGGLTNAYEEVLKRLNEVL